MRLDAGKHCDDSFGTGSRVLYRFKMLSLS